MMKNKKYNREGQSLGNGGSCGFMHGRSAGAVRKCGGAQGSDGEKGLLDVNKRGLIQASVH